ncbi:MAG: sugar ABC transporter permease [Deinococcales bacterium]
MRRFKFPASHSLGLPALILLSLFIFMPLLSVIRYATWQWSGLSEPQSVGFANFLRFAHDRELWRALKTTLFFALITLPGFLYLSRIIAEAIEGTRFERFIKALLFMPSLITIGGAAIAWYLLYNPNYGFIVELSRKLTYNLPCEVTLLQREVWLPCDGIALPWDSKPWAALLYISLFSLWQTVGYGVLVTSAALKSIPSAVQEAARVDGANENQIRRFIIGPLLRPSFVFLLIVGTVFVLQSYSAVFLLTRGAPYGSTEVLGYYLYKTSFERFELGYGAAITLAILALTLAIATLQARFLQRKDSDFT